MAFPAPSTIGANSVSASAATITPALPATLVNGNLLIAQVQIQSTGKIIATVTPGWTIIDSVNTGNMSAAWAQAIMATGLVAPVFAWTGVAVCQAQVIQYSGNAAGGTGAKAHATANASTTITTGALTTTADNSLILNILLASTNQTIPLLRDRTNITNTATADGSTRQCFGQVGKSGSVTDNPSDIITSANWVSFSIEVLGTGTGVAATERTSQVVQSTLENYSNPPVVHTSQVVLSTMESYSTPVIQVRTSQVVISVLRTVASIIFSQAIFTPFSQAQPTKVRTPAEWSSKLFEQPLPKQQISVFSSFSQPTTLARRIDEWQSRSFLTTPIRLISTSVFSSFSQPQFVKWQFIDEPTKVYFRKSLPPFTGFASFSEVVRAKPIIVLDWQFVPLPIVSEVRDTHDFGWIKRKKKPDALKLKIEEQEARRAALMLAAYGPEIEIKYEPTPFIEPKKPVNLGNLPQIIASIHHINYLDEQRRKADDDEEDLNMILKDIL